MPKADSNYFRYFTPSPEAEPWGLAVTAAGFSHIAAGATYPPLNHPSDHHFDWAHGRVLEALQIVFIRKGRGQLEFKEQSPVKLTPGMAFILVPKIWHRYRPDPQIGWEESWLEVQGRTVDRLLHAGVFRANDNVRSPADSAELAHQLDGIHTLARNATAGFNADLAGRALSVLASWSQSEKLTRDTSPLRRAILAAEKYFAEHYTESINIETLANKLGVAYSHFRREFAAHTGYAPWRYIIHLRLTHARRLLAASNSTLEVIAEMLGFSSAFHLSAAFKRAYGLSPNEWRRTLFNSP